MRGHKTAEVASFPAAAANADEAGDILPAELNCQAEITGTWIATWRSCIIYPYAPPGMLHAEKPCKFN
jgi:hypothetical protein